MPLAASPLNGTTKPSASLTKLLTDYNKQGAARQKRLAAERKSAVAFLEAASKRTQAMVEKASEGVLDLKEVRAALAQLGKMDDPDKQRSALAKLSTELAPGIAATRKALGLAGDGSVAFSGPARPLGGSVQRDLAAATLPLVDVLALLEAQGCVDHVLTSPFRLHGASEGGGVRDGHDLVVDTVWSFVGWPHDWAKLGAPFQVRAGDRDVTVSATPTIVNSVVGALSCGGFSHAWCQVRISVNDGARELASMSRELLNVSSWLGENRAAVGFDEFVTVPLTCSFSRRVGDSRNYIALVEASTDATMAGIGVATAALHVAVGTLTVHACGVA